MRQRVLNKFPIAGIGKMVAAFMLLLPFAAFAQVTITGKVLNNTDNKPIVNASVFLSNATIGDKTTADGTFTLQNVRPGVYDLVVSILGFQAVTKTITVANNNLVLPPVSLAEKAVALKEVVVKANNDPNRENYYYWFTDEFLGTSDLAKQCKILNPAMLDLVYDGATKTLTASSVDYLEIENDALGYRIKYLLTDFTLINKDSNEKKIFYKGPVFFEEMKGSAPQQRQWKKARQQVYENSPMHFLRAALNDKLDEEGFLVQQLAIYANPDRPADSLINNRISFYKAIKSRTADQKDSLSYWTKKSKLPVTLQKLLPYHLYKEDFITKTGLPGEYALSCQNDGLYVCYNKSHDFHTNSQLAYLTNPNNTENTLITFAAPGALFYSNGVIVNPYSVIYYGAWSKTRVAELLPINYEPEQSGAPDNKVKENIIAKLDAYSNRNVAEKVYLHFDKPYYAAGDTVYFKAYVTLGEGHKLSNLSGVLHAELINTTNKISQAIKLQMVEGVTWGDFALPDNMPPGNYTVRAYTRWMQNDGEAGYFHQTIPVGGTLSSKVPESGMPHKAQVSKPDMQFFPEGGGLVEGVSSKVAFKAVVSDGLGVAAKGVITDSEGATVAQFTTTHLGMGSFYLSPAKDKSYKAQITYADGAQDIVNLPAASAKGVTMTINNDSLPKATVKVIADNAWYQENKNKTMTLLVWSAGTVTTVPFVMDQPEISLDILKHPLHSGIAKVTLFSSAGEPVCERLIFIQNYNQLRVAINSDKASYSKREKVNISLNVKDWTGIATRGHFSASVIDESKVPVDETAESTIMTNLLLTSDLKGYVEQPNYYFVNTSGKTQSDLDLVMLTNGYRRFEWKKVLNDEYPPVAYQPEKALEIAGTAKNESGKPLIKTMMTLAPANGGALFKETTDSAGNFRFSDLLFTDSAKFFLHAMTAKGNNNSVLTYNPDNEDTLRAAAVKFINDTTLNQPPAGYLQNRAKQHEEAVKYGLAKEIMLKEVKIKKNKHTADDDYPSSKLGGAGNANQVIHGKDLSNLGRLSDQLQAAIPGLMFVQWPGTINRMVYLTVKFHTALANPPPMLIVVDGVKMDTDMTVDEINSNDVETIEVLKDENASIYGSLGGGGILAITTKRGGGDPGNNPSRGVLPITVAGFYKAREFYTPKYEHPQDAGDKKDLRSTIYWVPELITDKDGNVSFSFYNADGTGSYRVVVEGIDENGNLGRQVYRYKVE